MNNDSAGQVILTFLIYAVILGIELYLGVWAPCETFRDSWLDVPGRCVEIKKP